MRKYDLEDLSRAETYAQDDELATLVRRKIATREFDQVRGQMGRGEFKRALLAGEYPELVKTYVDRVASDDAERAASIEAGRQALSELELPDGYSLTNEGAPDGHVLLAGSFDDDLHKRLKRLGAQWITRTGWAIPLEKGKSLKRVIGNWRKAVAGKSAQQQRQEAERWLGYVEENAATGYLYQKGVDRLRSLDVGQWPELQDRLNRAMEEAAEVRREQEAKRAQEKAERWLGYVEDAANEGRRYAKGIATLKSLGIEQWPELQERLDAALIRAVEVASQKPTKARMLFPLGDSPPLNHPIRHGADVVVFEGHGKTFRINADHPSIHGAHLLGHEGELGAYFYYRDATEVERAQYEAEQAAARQRTSDLRELDQIAHRIASEGEYPISSEPITLDGEWLDHPRDPMNIHGGGKAFVKTRGHIYFLRNHGADGDSWANNNIRTGGAGAMGWRVPFDQDLWQRIEHLVAALSPEGTVICPDPDMSP